MRQSQKLESIGLLAGGIAHDFNNLLVGVIGNASLARGNASARNTRRRTALEHRQVRRTGRPPDPADARLCRQGPIHRRAGGFLGAGAGDASADPELDFEEDRAAIFNWISDLPAIEADRSQMQQVFMNLALNAAEAIGDNLGTRGFAPAITMRTSGICASDLKAGNRTGRYVFLEVRDTGCGMDAATRASIFDPFFTTKFPGRGLGLAAVAGIVGRRRACIEVITAPGAGSTFRVLFPAMAAAAAAPKPLLPSESDLQGQGTVLRGRRRRNRP